MNKKGRIIVMIVLALLILSPLDAIPDFIPFIGQFDDILYVLGIVSGVLKMLHDRQTDPEPEVIVDAQQWDSRN